MHRLPRDFDTSVFNGIALELVSFTENSIHFQFDRRISITLESSYAYHFDSSAGGVEKNDVPVTESRLMSLVGHIVQTAEIDDDGTTLRLRFGGGRILECFDKTPQYESFRIAIGDREVLV